MATPAARASGWAAQAAVELAARWPGKRRIVLADLDLEQPALHEVVGVPNEEGVVDLIDYGLSLERLVRRAPGGTFDLLPAGLFALDPGAILDSPAWERVLRDVAARRGTVLAYVPLEARGAGAIVRHTGAVLVLAEEDDGRAAVERLPHPYSVLAILVPQKDEPDIEPVSPPAETGMTQPTVAPSAEAWAESEQAGEEVAPAAAGVVEAPAEPPSAESMPALPAVVEDTAPESHVPPASPAEESGESESRPREGSAEEPEARTAASSETVPASAEESAEPRVTDEVFARIRLPRDEDRAALIAELRDRQRAARLAGEPGRKPSPGADAGDRPMLQAVPSSGGLLARDVELESRPEEVGLDTLTPPRRGPGRTGAGRYRHALVWTAGVVLLASLLAGAWHFLSGRLPRQTAAAAPGESTGMPNEQEARLAADALPYVVAIEAHRDLALAVGRILDLEEIEPELPFHIEPVERDGVLFYHVMAGPVPDSAAALALRDTLISRGHKTGLTPTDVRATPLAFLVGDYATAADADEQAAVLRRLDIPGYVLPASAADGEPVFRLYVGGFGGEAEAGAVGQMLRAAGIRDTLVTRTGAVRLHVLRAPSDGMGIDSTATGSINP